MNEIKFNSQVCTSIEQSVRLLELGLNPETADCTWAIINKEPVAFIGKTKIDCSKITINGEDMEKKEIEHFPAWSLHMLILLCSVTTMFTRDVLPKAYDDQINAIENLIKNGYFNKEYLV